MNAVRCFYATRPTDRPDCHLVATASVGSIPLCSSCLQRRSTLGKGDPVRPLPTDNHHLDPLHAITRAAADVHAAEHALLAAVRDARRDGHTWADIGRIGGVAIEAVTGAVVAAGGAGVGMVGEVLHVTERDAGVESGGDGRMSVRDRGSDPDVA